MDDIVRKSETDRFGNEIREVYNNGVLMERTTYNKKGEMVAVELVED